MCTASRGPSQWATRGNSSRRKKKTRRWPKPASGSSRTAFLLELSLSVAEVGRDQGESRQALLDAVAHGSTVAWRHLNLLGEYDFSAEKLRDSVGIRLPKLGG